MAAGGMRRLCPALLALALLCSACSGAAPAPSTAPETRIEAEGRLAAQLGLLQDKINADEYRRCLALMEQLLPLQRERLARGEYEKSAREKRLVKELHDLYEDYTAAYLGGDGEGWGYEEPPEQILTEYAIAADGTLSRESAGDGAGRSEAEDRALWNQMTAMLPAGAWTSFERFTVFTDGEDETLAYVQQLDDRGDRWQIAVDPADSRDGEWFTETVLHEYCHYLTLCSAQAEYTDRQTTDTYNEPGLVSREDSYLNAFYQAFWSDYLDDRLADMDSYGFFLRHEDDFITDYASTSPAEDIAESFVYFLRWDRQSGEEIWVKKLNFFYRYPELVEFRRQMRVLSGATA